MDGPLPDDAAPREARAYARLVVALRWPIVLAWIAAAVAASLYLPSIGSSSDASPEGLVADNSEAIAAQKRSYQLFGYPLLTESAIVQRAPDGLSVDAIERAARRTADSAAGLPGMEGLALAAPVVNEQALLPFARENRTSIVTYLYFDPATSIGDRYRVGHDFAARYVSDPSDHLVGLTGVIPARVEQEDAIEDALPWIELATVVLIAGVIGLTMRSLLAPLMTLLAAGLAYAIAVRVITLERRAGRRRRAARARAAHPRAAARHRDRLRDLLHVGVPAPALRRARPPRGGPPRDRAHDPDRARGRPDRHGGHRDARRRHAGLLPRAGPGPGADGRHRRRDRAHPRAGLARDRRRPGVPWRRRPRRRPATRRASPLRAGCTGLRARGCWPGSWPSPAPPASSTRRPSCARPSSASRSCAACLPTPRRGRPPRPPRRGSCQV